jgi:hypothetical protein
MTVVNPCSKGLSKDLLRRWYVAADSLILRIDGMCGPDPKRPPSLDLLVYLGAHKKRHAAGQRIDPNNAATGLTTKDALSGAARVIVFRREDAVKALAHELLRCYGVSKWTNQDGEILHRCREAATLLGLRVPSALKPAEAIVDLFATRIAVDQFSAGKPAAWRDCAIHAGRLAADLVLSWSGDQTAPAYESLCVSAMMYSVSERLFAAHRSGLQRPDKAGVRAAFARMGRAGGGAPLAAGRRRAIMSLRSTPASVSPVPPR